MRRKFLIFLLLLSMGAAFSMNACSKPTAGWVGQEYTAIGMKGIVTDAALANEIIDSDGNKHSGEDGYQFAVITIKIELENGDWAAIREIDFSKSEVNHPTYQIDKDMTVIANGYDILAQNTTDYKEVKLIFQVSNDYEDLYHFSLEIYQSGVLKFIILYPN